MQVIVYKNDDGSLAIITPADPSTIQATALRDVPTGKPFAIIDSADLPADRTYRDAWTIADNLLTDGVGA